MMVALNPTTLLATGPRCAAVPDEFVAAFRRLAISLDRDGELTLVGRRLVQNQLLRILRERRALEAAPLGAWSEEPRVVVIVGLPRTGTTVLHHLLVRRYVTDFVPLPEALEPFAPSGADGDDGRASRARAYLAFLDRLSPQLRALHPMTIDGPEECDVAFQLTGVSDWFSIAHRITNYTRWVEQVNRAEAYRVYRRLLAHRRPHAEALVLKSPSHLAHLAELFDTFADCRVVWLHRPASAAVPSFVHLVRAARAVTGQADEVGALRTEWLPRLERRVSVSRRWLDDPRVLHVHYDDLVHATEATLERIATHADLRVRAGAVSHQAVCAGLRRVSGRDAPSVSWPPDHGVREFDPWLA